MSRTRKDAKRGSHRERRISVQGVRRLPPDLSRMSRAAIRLAMEQAAAEKAAEEADAQLADKREEDPDD